MENSTYPDGAWGYRGAIGSEPKPYNEYERSVLRVLEHHGEMESGILESYRSMAQRSSAGESIQYLVRLILEDEERHHAVFAEMANELRSMLWEIPVEPRLPAMRTSVDPDLLAETKRLLASERRDEKELRTLHKTLRARPASSLDPLMVELMLHDTAKHIAILKFIKAHLAR
jgi:hypothetical protein